jgi:hypothetical protein
MPSAAGGIHKGQHVVEEGTGIRRVAQAAQRRTEDLGIRFGQTEFVRQHVGAETLEQRKLRPQEMPLHLVGVGDQRDLGATEESLDHRQDFLVDAEIAGPDLEESLRIHHRGGARSLAYRAPKLVARQGSAVAGIPQGEQAFADHFGRRAAVLGQAAEEHVVVVKGKDVAQVQKDDFDSRHVNQASSTGRN